MDDENNTRGSGKIKKKIGPSKIAWMFPCLSRMCVPVFMSHHTQTGMFWGYTYFFYIHCNCTAFVSWQSINVCFIQDNFQHWWTCLIQNYYVDISLSDKLKYFSWHRKPAQIICLFLILYYRWQWFIISPLHGHYH